MPLSVAKQRTNTGQTIGAAVVAGAYYDALTGNVAPTYVDGGSGNVAVGFSAIPAGSNGMVRDNAAGDSVFGQLTFDFLLPSLPSQAAVISEIRNATTKISTLLVNISGGNATFLVRNAADTGLTGWTAGTTLALNTWYRVAVALQVDTITTGKIKAQLTRLSDSVVLSSGETTTLNNGTTNVALHQSGKVGTAGTIDLMVDNLAFWDSAYAYVPAAVDVNHAPTATLQADLTTSVEPGKTVTLTLGGSDPDNNPLTSTLRQIGTPVVALTGSGGVGSTRTFMAPYTLAGVTLTFGHIVNDGTVDSTEATATVAVLRATERLVTAGGEVPLRIISV